MRLRSGLLLVLGACAPAIAEVEPTSPPAEDPAVDTARFVGTWLVEETMPHATYFASKWRFADDGSLSLVEDFSFGGGLYPSVSWTGDKEILCTFGGRWSSPDDRTVRIDTLCSDAEVRVLELTFATDSAGNAVGIEPESMRVDGDEAGWSAPVWGWRFFKCDGDGANCDPWQPG